MAIEQAPKHPVPVGFVPKGGSRYRVKDGDSWVSVAATAHVDVWNLIEFNFRTRKPAEVNWYLRRNVGCTKTTADGKNYVFTSTASPGVIYLPPTTPRIHYAVPGVFNIIAQPSNMTCWATVGAMMMSWRDQVSYPIAEAMSQCGAKWAKMFADGKGLGAGDHAAFARATGMSYEQMGCFPGETWEQMLRAHGPLAVVTANPYHARILVGISGDGTYAGTTVDLIDPNGGRRYRLNFGKFSDDFEDVSNSPRFQIWHY
jgi:hypothetical protein